MSVNHSHITIFAATQLMLLLGGWVAATVMAGRSFRTSIRFGTHIISFIFALAFWRQFLRLAESAVETSGSWPSEWLALAASVASATAFSTYVRESSRTRSGIYYLPAMMRISMVGLLAVMLLDPVSTYSVEHEEHRQVVVLLDRSSSMKLSVGPITGPGNLKDHELLRETVADDVLFRGRNGHRPLQELLRDQFDLRQYEFAESARLSPESPTAVPEGKPQDGVNADDHWSASTQLGTALTRVSNDLNATKLSGVILITDGCDHSSEDMSQAVRWLSKANIPVNTVLIGNEIPVKDVEVSAIQAPPQVFTGDDVPIRTVIRACQMSGETLRVQLRRDGETIEERRLNITADQFRETLSFEDTPNKSGIYQYEIKVEEIQSEAISENNVRSASVQVSDDHLKLLIIDERPRWEFRYLRNLFAGRDRSVALQYVLLRPDRLDGVPDPELIPASASRAFDDCDSNALPESESEWLKFDVIVLGDVSPEELPPEVQRLLDKFVRLRGGSLIVIAGPRAMPHGYSNAPLAELLPGQLQGQRPVQQTVRSDRGYQLRIVNEQLEHVIVQQSFNRDENTAVWNSLPQMYWRHSGAPAKPGATVLAWAESTANNNAEKISDAQLTELQRENPLILWHRFGAGKVLQLNFDETWRLRYGIGDQRHHRFWGQVMRWAAQDRLPVGTQSIRMGTNQTSYRTGDRILVKARISDVTGEAGPVEVIANLYAGDQLVHSVPMQIRPDAGSLLEATLQLPEVPGRYCVELSGDSVVRQLQLDKQSDARVFTEIYSEGPDLTGESADLVASSTVVTRLAEQTGGLVATPETASRVLENLGPQSSYRRDKYTVPLWNRWPVIAVFLLLAGGEWTIRKSTGLI